MAHRRTASTSTWVTSISGQSSSPSYAHCQLKSTYRIAKCSLSRTPRDRYGVWLKVRRNKSSFSEDEPVSLSLKSVIKGWKEGIQLMPVGSVFVFLIPPELAYGTKGSGVISPNATLIFEVELFK